MFKCSVRDMLWLTLVVALALGWFCHSTAMDQRYAKMEQRYAARSAYIESLKDALALEIGESAALWNIVTADHPAIDLLSVRGALPPHLENEDAKRPVTNLEPSFRSW